MRHSECLHRVPPVALLLKRLLAKSESHKGRLAATFARDIGGLSEYFPSLPTPI